MSEKCGNYVEVIKSDSVIINDILIVGTSDKERKSYENISQKFGNVSPVMVRPVKDAAGLFETVYWQANFDGLMGTGEKEILAVVADVIDELAAVELSLSMTTIQKSNTSIMEAIMVKKLMDGNKSTKEIMEITQKSKSWVSQRKKLALSLADPVMGLVINRSISTRSAEEIANLPMESQQEFAKKVVDENLNDYAVHRLVSRYNSGDAEPTEMEQIIRDPASVIQKPDKKVRTKGCDKNNEKEKKKDGEFKSRLVYLLKCLSAASVLASSAAVEDFKENIALIRDIAKLYHDFEIKTQIKLSDTDPAEEVPRKDARDGLRPETGPGKSGRVGRCVPW
jgi:hypothetical protein